MKHLFTLLPLVFFVASCSIIGGPNGYFPEKKYDFLEEEIESAITIPGDLDPPDTENHYPVGDQSNIENVLEVPKPRQIFSSTSLHISDILLGTTFAATEITPSPPF